MVTTVLKSWHVYLKVIQLPLFTSSHVTIYAGDQTNRLPKETMIIHSMGILFKRLKTVIFFSAGSSTSKAALLLKQERRQQENEATVKVRCSSQHPGSPSSQLLRLTLKDTPPHGLHRLPGTPAPTVSHRRFGKIQVLRSVPARH